MSTPSFQIGSRKIGPGEPCLIVAEVSANHNGSLDRAIEIVCAARAAGADAVKLQTYTPDTMTIDSDREWFRVPDNTLWSGKTLYQLYGEAYTPWQWHADLFRVAREEGLICFSTPFDASAVAFLESLDAPVYKVASFELVDTPLLEAIGRTRKPVILSTGMATLAEIGQAVATLRGSGAAAVALLKCTSAYPAPPESMNLRTIADLQDRFGVVGGLSDHSMGGAVAVAAAALGAAIIEKHFTLARVDGGPDSAFSMEPAEFALMVAQVRQAEKAVGGVSYTRSAAEETTVTFRRSLFIVQDVKKGEPFTHQNVRSIRPGFGLPPGELPNVMGCTASRDLTRGTPLTWDAIVTDRGLRLRRVHADDLDLLFRWVNDEDVRLGSLDSAPVTYETHVAWFEDRCRRHDCVMFIALNGQEPVGQVRFDLAGEGATIDISIDRAHRGHGYASDVLGLACDALRFAAPHVHAVTAHVKPNNAASRGAFARAGFVEQGTHIINGQPVVELQRPIRHHVQA
jgi:pseudaminic acid synthase